MGIKKITGQVIVDDSLTSSKPPAGKPKRLRTSYAAPVGAIPELQRRIGALASKRFGKTRFDASGAPGRLRDPRRQSKHQSVPVASQTRAGPDTTLMQVSGTIRPRAKPLRIFRRIYDPGLYFGSALTAFLQIHGSKCVTTWFGAICRQALVCSTGSFVDPGRGHQHLEQVFEQLHGRNPHQNHRCRPGRLPGTFQNGLAAVQYF